MNNFSRNEIVRQKKIENLLNAHLSALTDSTEIIAIGTPNTIERFEYDCKNIGIQNNIRSYAIDKVRHGVIREDLIDESVKSTIFKIRDGIVNNISNVIVVLTDDIIPTLRFFHSITAPLKKLGTIVVTIYNRSIYINPITESTIGDEQIKMFRKAGQYALGNNPDGDFMEFGVFDGRTVTLAWQTFARKSNSLRLFGFDSFEGIVGTTDSETSNFPEGSFYSNIETFNHNMKACGIPENRVIPIQGDFLNIFPDPDVLYAKHEMRKCSIAHIDCDVYVAAKASLDFLSELLEQGSVLLFDEFNVHKASNFTGERRALKEWLDENKNYEVERWYDYGIACRSFFVHKLQ